MILDKAEIEKIILKNPYKGLVSIGQAYNREMRKHFFGEDLEATLTTVQGFEREGLRKLRVKYARSNRDTFTRLSRPVDKVFSARGGSLYYNLPETQEKSARAYSLNIKGGYSIKKWLEQFWKPQYMADPNGIIFMEMEEPSTAARLKRMGRSFVYPTYKSIQNIYDYKPNGSRLEYVVFKVSADEKEAAGFKPDDRIYRVVDDAYDYWVKVEDGVDKQSVRILDDYSMPNFFMEVPAILNSDIVNPKQAGTMVSIFDEVLELANNFLVKGSIKTTHEFFHAYPKYWEYADKCKSCKGEGVVNGADCPDCNRSGKSVMSSVSDVKVLNWPGSKEDAVVTPNVAGYISPDKIFYEIATHDLQMLEDLMSFTIWGASASVKTQGMSTDASGGTQTATEIMNDIKPQSDRLQPISECAESRHKFILDSIIRVQVSQFYQGASVNYGKRYMIESPDDIWAKYSDARQKGAACSVLDDLLLEYYEAKYNSDPVKLSIQIKLMKLEPFVHLTTMQLKALGASGDDYKAKLYFSEWLSGLSESDLLVKDLQQLRDESIAYAALKVLPEPKLLNPAA